MPILVTLYVTLLIIIVDGIVTEAPLTHAVTLALLTPTVYVYVSVDPRLSIFTVNNKDA